MAIWKWRGTIPFGFNTAGGMDCMQFGRSTHFRCPRHVSIPQAVWIACNYYEKGICIVPMLSFQYRKRYGLHAILCCHQQGVLRRTVSIPQAVWIACNSSNGVVVLPRFAPFQYRKRYGLHAIPSLTALGTAEPRSGFSKRSALFGKSPQPRGIFLSPKSAENVRKPCDIKETFVHGKNLKLMAFSPKSLPSL